MIGKIEQYFDFESLKTNFKTEIIAGITTFVSMAYILFVNPNVLGASGMNKGAVFTATALTAAIGCLIMGVVAKYPFTVAPGLGINAFFTFTVVKGMGVSWKTALSGVFLASIIFILITVFKIREAIINSIPQDMKLAIAAGIGMFIAFLGLQEGGVIVANDSTLVGMGSLSVGTTWLTIFGIIITAILMVKKIPGSVFIGMILTTIVGLVTKLIPLPSAIISSVPSIKSTFMVAPQHIGDFNSIQMIAVVLTFLMVTFFDTAGTFVALAEQAGFMKNNELPRVGKALTADSSTMMIGSLLGTSPTTSYVEASAGIAVGGRSGFTSVIVSILFVLSLFFSPLLTIITSNVTAPALIVVGVLMATSLKKINWDNLEIAIPAFMTIISMPLTYSISDGIAIGFIFYPVTMITAKRGKEIHPLMYVLALIFIAFFLITNK
ncbi:NCS2 family permease [Companilactobacillus sp. DQM5]|uniref:NCS2 family permease n=1 Tax=Companilactobacillus sp. DQM5 TaxID=3463359 RepID=UPI004058EC1A